MEATHAWQQAVEMATPMYLGDLDGKDGISGGFEWGFDRDF
jgi:hypothetical protein